MSNDSSDSDDESQEPKGKRIFSGRGPSGKELHVVSESVPHDANDSLCLSP